MFKDELEKKCGSGGRAMFSEAFGSGAKNFVVLVGVKIGGNVGNDACPKFVDGRS